MHSEIEERPVGRREARKQERRAAIVAAARRLFLDDGYAATSMSSILEKMGGSKSTLWSYFRSKEELFAAVIEDVTHGFREQLEGELMVDGKLDATLPTFCRGLMSRTANPDAIAAWRLVVSESGRFPEVGRIFYERAASHLEQALADYLRHQIRAGLLRDEGPLSMAQLLISMCTAPQTRLLLGVESGDKDAAAEQIAEYFLRLFEIKYP